MYKMRSMLRKKGSMLRIWRDMETEEERAGRTIVRLAHRMVALRNADLACLDITDSQAEMLHLVRQHPGADLTKLGELSGSTRQTSAGVVQRLEEKGLVEISKSKRDGRSREIALSATGTQTERRIDSFRCRTGSLLLQGMDASERASFVRLLDQALANLEDVAEEGQN